MLLDEPCSALDPSSRERVIALLQSLAQEGRSICLTSHDRGPALMELRPGDRAGPTNFV